MATYTRLLGHFCASHREDMVRLEEHLRAGDRGGARRVAHTLKGVAGTLGMSGVQSLAKELELACNEGREEETIRAQAQVLDEVVRRFVGELERCLPRGEAPIQKITAVDLGVGLASLRRLLETDDIGAGELYRQMQVGLQSLNGPVSVRLGQEIGSFAYTDALRTLDEFQRR